MNNNKKKNQKSKVSERLYIRVTPYEKNFIKGLAEMYAGGNVSLFMVFAAFNSERKFLSEDDLVKSDRRIIKGKKRGLNEPPGEIK